MSAVGVTMTAGRTLRKPFASTSSAQTTLPSFASLAALTALTRPPARRDCLYPRTTPAAAAFWVHVPIDLLASPQRVSQRHGLGFALRTSEPTRLIARPRLAIYLASAYGKASSCLGKAPSCLGS